MLRIIKMLTCSGSRACPSIFQILQIMHLIYDGPLEIMVVCVQCLKHGMIFEGYKGFPCRTLCVCVIRGEWVIFFGMLLACN